MFKKSSATEISDKDVIEQLIHFAPFESINQTFLINYLKEYKDATLGLPGKNLYSFISPRSTVHGEASYLGEVFMHQLEAFYKSKLKFLKYRHLKLIELDWIQLDKNQIAVNDTFTSLQHDLLKAGFLAGKELCRLKEFDKAKQVLTLARLLQLSCFNYFHNNFSAQ